MPELRLHILNVGHGDSIVVEYLGENETVYGLIDSNCRGTDEPRALTKLRSLGATSLSFVCLTHPHADHYRGLFDVLTYFRGEIGDFYSFPIGNVLANRKRLKNLAKLYRQIRDQQDDQEIKNRCQEFIKILRFAEEEFLPDRWTELSGERVAMAPEGFAGVTLESILPPARAKGYYFQQIDQESLGVVESLKENELSVAIQIGFAGVRTVLGGDGTQRNWFLHRQWQRRRNDSLKSTIVKLPHHGSNADCDDDTLDNLFDWESGSCVAVVSANGQSHPHADVLGWLMEKGIRPHCTNLAAQWRCEITELLALPNLDPPLRTWINQVSESSVGVQPCQGDITVTISSTGSVRVDPQFDHVCGCSGAIQSLFA